MDLRKLGTSFTYLLILAGLSACAGKTSIGGLTGDSGDGSGVFASREGEDFTSVDAPDDSDWGSPANITGVDQSAMNEFMSSVNRDQNSERIYLKVDAEEVDGVRLFKGEIRFAYNYEQNGQTIYKETLFSVDEYTQSELYNIPPENPEDAYRFNRFYDDDGVEKLVLLFEEEDRYNNGSWYYGYGAMMLIMEIDDEGVASGSLYFKNYEVSQNVNSRKPATKCWDIEIGNFSCRDFLVNDDMRPDLTLDVDEFEKIGNFNGLDFNEALNN